MELIEKEDRSQTKRDQNSSFLCIKVASENTIYYLAKWTFNIFFILRNGFNLALKSAGIPFAGMGTAHMVESKIQCPLCTGNQLGKGAQPTRGFSQTHITLTHSSSQREVWERNEEREAKGKGVGSSS